MGNIVDGIQRPLRVRNPRRTPLPLLTVSHSSLSKSCPSQSIYLAGSTRMRWTGHISGISPPSISRPETMFRGETFSVAFTKTRLSIATKSCFPLALWVRSPKSLRKEVMRSMWVCLTLPPNWRVHPHTRMLSWKLNSKGKPPNIP